MLIPFNKPFLTGKETHYVERAFEKGHFSGDGEFTRICSHMLRALLGCPGVILTTSCTHALEMAALLLDVRPGDEVIVPSFTFVSTVNAFILRGVKPVFVDIRPDTLNMDETQLSSVISPNTKVLVPVHYGGVGCEMDTIGQLAEKHGLFVVEDNAHGFGARYRGRCLGTFGCLAALSFHETKNLSCGEGGALLINRPCYIQPAEVIRDKGTNRSRYYRGEVDKYTWVSLGSSYALADILAAFLLAQLEDFENIQRQRADLWDYYYRSLEGLQKSCGVRLPFVPEYCTQSYHVFYLVTRSRDERTALIDHLKAREVNAVFHYTPLHTSEMGRRFGGTPGQCPVTEDVSDRLLRLPFYNTLKRDEQDRVIDAVIAFYERR